MACRMADLLRGDQLLQGMTRTCYNTVLCYSHVIVHEQLRVVYTHVTLQIRKKEVAKSEERKFTIT